MSTIRDSAFDKIKKARGKRQDEMIDDLALMCAVYELTGGKRSVSFTEKQIEPIYKDMYFQVLFEFMARSGKLKAQYSKTGKIKSMRMTTKGVKDAKKLLSKLKG